MCVCVCVCVCDGMCVCSCINVCVCLCDVCACVCKQNHVCVVSLPLIDMQSDDNEMRNSFLLGEPSPLRFLIENKILTTVCDLLY